MLEVSGIIPEVVGSFQAGSNNKPGSIVPCRVLLVGSDPFISTDVGGALLEKGCQVTLREDLSEAFLLLEYCSFDILMSGLGKSPHKSLLMLQKAYDYNPEMRIVVFAKERLELPKEGPFPVASLVPQACTMSEIREHLDDWLTSVKSHGRKLHDNRTAQVLNDKVLKLLMVMSHDLRGSLLSVGSGLHLLSRGFFGGLDERASEKACDLYSRLRSLAGITEDFLGKAFSLTEEIELNNETLDLMRDILAPILEEVSAEARDKSVAIEIHPNICPERSLQVKADPVWLGTVFRNLLRNAIKYARRGSVIRIGVRTKDKDYKINVYNDGQPVPEQFRPKLFDRFARFQCHRAATSGMGLGLYLIRDIVHKHGGRIWYQPRENGSNFVFTLPRVCGR